MTTLNELINLYESGKGQNESIDQQRLAFIQSKLEQVNPSQINEDRGASFGVRANVGAAQSQEDRLATLRKFYPEAIPTGEDNFLAVNRRNNQPFLYNPPGADMGDVAEYGREIASAAGGIGAAAFAAPTAISGAGPYIAGGAGTAGAGYLYDQGMEYLGETVDTRTFGEQVQDYSVEAGLGMLPIDKAFAPVMNFARETIIRPAQQRVRDVVSKYQIRPTAGTVGGGLLQSFEAGFQRMAASMDVFRDAADEMYGGIENVIESAFTGMGGRIGRMQAGDMAVDKGQKFIQTFRAESDELYKLVDEHIPADTALVPESLKNTASAMLGKDALGELFEPNLARRIIDTMEAGGATTSYASLAQIRSEIGAQIAAKETVGPGNIGLGNAKKLYSAITEDMKALAQAQGDDAMAAWEAANDFYRVGQRTIDDVIVPTMTTKGGSEWLPGEKVMDKVASLARQNPKGLSRLADDNVLTKNDMGQLGAGLLEDLGQGAPGSAAVIEGRISPTRIPQQTSTKVLPEKSKDVLFDAPTVEILDDLRTLTAQIKQTDSLVNYSGTANTGSVAAGFGATGAIGGALLSGDVATAGAVGASLLLGGVVMPYLASKGIQNKAFLKWVTEGAKNGTGPEWRRAGARMASKEQLMNVYDAIIELEEGNDGNVEDRGVLFAPSLL